MLDEVFAALEAYEQGEGSVRATSLRMSSALHEAVSLATELGMDVSLTAATSAALAERVRGFARHKALAEHFELHPSDIPALADVARRRVSGTGHPAETHPAIVDRVALHVERSAPTWWRDGTLDATVDRVLDGVELVLASGGEATTQVSA